MKVKVNLDLFGSVDEQIELELGKSSIPSCLGNMCPPLISSIVDIDSELLLAKKESMPEENFSKINPSDIFASERDCEIFPDFGVSVPGEARLRELREKSIDKYVSRLKKCAAPCKYMDLCHKLTTHYLNTIKLYSECGGR